MSISPQLFWGKCPKQDNYLPHSKITVFVNPVQEAITTGVFKSYESKFPIRTIDRVDFDPRYHEVVGDI